MQHGHKDHQEVPQEVEPAMGSWKTKYLVWERVVSFTSGIIGQEGEIVAGKGGHVGIADNEVGGDKGNNTKNKEEKDWIIAIEFCKHLFSKAWILVFKSVSRCKTSRKKNRRKSCPDIFTSIRLDNDGGNNVVDNDHDENEQKDKEMQVATKQCNDKASYNNLNKVEQ